MPLGCGSCSLSTVVNKSFLIFQIQVPGPENSLQCPVSSQEWSRLICSDSPFCICSTWFSFLHFTGPHPDKTVAMVRHFQTQGLQSTVQRPAEVLLVSHFCRLCWLLITLRIRQGLCAHQGGGFLCTYHFTPCC